MVCEVTGGGGGRQGRAERFRGEAEGFRAEVRGHYLWRAVCCFKGPPFKATFDLSRGYRVSRRDAHPPTRLTAGQARGWQGRLRVSVRVFSLSP